MEKEIEKMLEKHQLWLDNHPDGEKANFDNYNFGKIDLTGIDLSNLKISGASFRKTVLTNANFSGSELTNVDFRGAILINSNFSNTKLEGCDLRRTRCDNINFKNSNISTCLLKNSKFIESDFTDSKIISSDLSESNFKNSNFENVVLEYMEFFNCNFSKVNFKNADLSGAIIQYSSLINANLENANLENTNLTGNKLKGVDFQNTLGTPNVMLDMEETWGFCSLNDGNIGELVIYKDALTEFISKGMFRASKAFVMQIMNKYGMPIEYAHNINTNSSKVMNYQMFKWVEAEDFEKNHSGIDFFLTKKAAIQYSKTRTDL